jgi:hypothetical protein
MRKPTTSKQLADHFRKRRDNAMRAARRLRAGNDLNIPCAPGAQDELVSEAVQVARLHQHRMLRTITGVAP